MSDDSYIMRVCGAGRAGGLDWEGYEWMLQNNSGQIASAASYGPYLNQEGFCHFDLSRNLTQPLELNGDAFVAAPVAMITGWRTTAVYASNSTDTNDPAVLKTLKTNVSIANLEGQLISGGPVSISVDTPVDFYCELAQSCSPRSMIVSMVDGCGVAGHWSCPI
eukprot:SAG31_NODE_3629_length_4049_cov_3.487089_2_plen_164_part_00